MLFLCGVVIMREVLFSCVRSTEKERPSAMRSETASSGTSSSDLVWGLGFRVWGFVGFGRFRVWCSAFGV